MGYGNRARRDRISSKIELDRFPECGYFAVTSDTGLPEGGFLLSEEQMQRQEDKSQDGTMPRRLGLAVCFIA